MSDAGTAHWLDDREQRAWRAFLSTHARLMAQLGRELQTSSGLSLADYSVLVDISEHPGSRVRILELARALQWEKSRLSHQLSRMQHRDLIERSSCQEDRRGAWVALTDAGREALRSVAPDHVAAVRRYFLDDLPPALLEALVDVCTHVLARLPDGDSVADADPEGDKAVGDVTACPSPS